MAGLLSLAAGASVGPEYPLSAMGGGESMFIGTVAGPVYLFPAPTAVASIVVSHLRLPRGSVPLPFTFLAMGAFLLECSSYQTAAIFIAMLSAHGFTTGLGVLHRLTGSSSLGAWADEVPSLKEPLVYAQKAPIMAKKTADGVADTQETPQPVASTQAPPAAVVAPDEVGSAANDQPIGV